MQCGRVSECGPWHHGGAEGSVGGIDVLTQQPLHLRTPATPRIFSVGVVT